MTLCTCLFAQDPNRFDNISYANWATIIFPIIDGGGRTCLFLMTLFVILSMSLDPFLQRCCQGDHPFIAFIPLCPMQSSAKQSRCKLDLDHFNKQRRAFITVYMCTVYGHSHTHPHVYTPTCLITELSVKRYKSLSDFFIHICIELKVYSIHPFSSAYLVSGHNGSKISNIYQFPW